MNSNRACIIARTQDVDIASLMKLVQFLDLNGVVSVPIVFPLIYDVYAYDWDKGTYDISELMKSFRRQVGFDEIPLLVLVGKKAPISEELHCSKDSKLCLLPHNYLVSESLIQDLNKVLF